MFDFIDEWLRETLTDGITGNFSNMFDEINTKVGDIAGQVGQTPQGWNSAVFDMVRDLSDTVIIPIAGMILTFVLCYELIHLIIERNNMHDIDTFIFFKWIFKAFIAVYFVTHTFDIVMGIFTLAQNVVDGSAGIISGSMDLNLALTDLATELEAMGTGELLGLYLESAIMRLAIQAIATLTTGSNGKAINELSAGVYYLHEETSPPGYAPDSNKYNFYVTTGQTADVLVLKQKNAPPIYIPKTGEAFPWWNYGLAVVCLGAAVLFFIGLARTRGRD